ncbi:MAG: IS3 family transposase [Oceanospirillaceae bacterium]|nr:IS3 family transposase [Oceanospirillaceae bacterium]
MSTKQNLVQEADRLSKREKCHILDISRSFLYYKPSVTFSEEDLSILNRMDEIYTECPMYGYRRQYETLISEQFHIGIDRVRQYMKVLGIEAIYPKRNTSIPNKKHLIYPYLLKGLSIDHPNHVWAIDITYIRLTGGFCYLVALIDWYSRYILSWRLSNCLDKDFCIEALEDALMRYPLPKICNSDQGSQFTSLAFTGVLSGQKIKISMDSVGRWADNIIIERWFRTLKYEDVYINDYASMKDIQTGCDRYINFYNTKRIHSSLAYKTPHQIYWSLND